MFGYVRPLQAELKVRTLQQYRASYCGLCRTLGKRFGFAARFTVSYDLVFLYLLLSGTESLQKTEVCRCPAKPWRKCACAPFSAALDQAAAANVIMTYWKLDDAVHDEHGPRSIAARLGKLFLHGAYQRAERMTPELAKETQTRLHTLALLEERRAPEMDAYADAFSSILAAMADFFEKPELQRPAREVLYHVGRYLYLTDALDDLPKDMKNGSFNPLIPRFSIGAEGLSQEDRQYLLKTIDSSIGRAAAALELLPLKGCDEILHNIIYLGLPAVLKSVEDGSFHKKKNKTGGSYERSL